MQYLLPFIKLYYTMFYKYYYRVLLPLMMISKPFSLYSDFKEAREAVSLSFPSAYKGTKGDNTANVQ